MKPLVIIGASGHGKVVADIAEQNGYSDIRFLDDDSSIKTCGKYTVTGNTRELGKVGDADCIVAIGNAKIRERMLDELVSMGANVVSLLHPQAVVAGSAHIGIGTVVMAGAVINPDAKIGRGCIVNTCASVDHDCEIGDYVHISVGAHMAGTVTAGDRSWIGAGAVVINNIEITSDCIIGAGAVVVNNITEAGTYVGVPARKLQ